MRIIVEGTVLTLMGTPKGADVTQGLRATTSGDGVGDTLGGEPESEIGGVTASCS